jgi:GNAT superfamily N-acetyltransferase
MPQIDVVVESAVSQSVRAAQVSSMFDVPPSDIARLEWHGSMPIEERPWNIGLIVGPSGAGKTSIMRQTFGEPISFAWGGASVIDDFDPAFGVGAVTDICMAVGFNTIPAWLRPYRVLSNGEQFRVDLARRLLEGGDLVVCDEFTSVVDRQVATIGAHAVQKFIRKAGRKFVAVTCHYDLEEWLQPDWVFEPATMTFRWRSVQRRPDIRCRVEHVPYGAWERFARFHYMTADLSRSARCFQLSVDGAPAAFCASLFRPHPRVDNIYGISRLVTLPDFQGLGLAFALVDRVGQAYRAKGFRLRCYPAHPGLVRAYDRSRMWRLDKKPGRVTSNRNDTTTIAAGSFGGRPCAVFEYVGPAGSKEDAAILLG